MITWTKRLLLVTALAVAILLMVAFMRAALLEGGVGILFETERKTETIPHGADADWIRTRHEKDGWTWVPGIHISGLGTTRVPFARVRLSAYWPFSEFGLEPEGT